MLSVSKIIEENLLSFEIIEVKSDFLSIFVRKPYFISEIVLMSNLSFYPNRRKKKPASF
jgi:hypothetical protein